MEGSEDRKGGGDTRITIDDRKLQKRTLHLREEKLIASFTMQSDFRTKHSNTEAWRNADYDIQTLRELRQIFIIPTVI